MAITTVADAATVGTSPYYIGADSTTKALQTIARRIRVTIDWTNVAEGDRFVAKLVRVINGTERTQIVGYAQGPSVSPLDIVFDGIAAGWDVTITKEAGTDRSIAWAITYEDLTGYELSAASIDAIFDEVYETGRTLREHLRLAASAMWGKLSGAATTTNTFRDQNDSKDRITATVDSDGNRTAITTDDT